MYDGPPNRAMIYAREKKYRLPHDDIFCDPDENRLRPSSVCPPFCLSTCLLVALFAHQLGRLLAYNIYAVQDTACWLWDGLISSQFSLYCRYHLKVSFTLLFYIVCCSDSLLWSGSTFPSTKGLYYLLRPSKRLIWHEMMSFYDVSHFPYRKSRLAVSRAKTCWSTLD